MCFVVGLVPEPVITLSVQGACTTVEEEEANVESEWHIIVSPSAPRWVFETAVKAPAVSAGWPYAGLQAFAE